MFSMFSLGLNPCGTLWFETALLLPRNGTVEFLILTRPQKILWNKAAVSVAPLERNAEFHHTIKLRKNFEVFSKDFWKIAQNFFRFTISSNILRKLVKNSPACGKLSYVHRFLVALPWWSSTERRYWFLNENEENYELLWWTT